MSGDFALLSDLLEKLEESASGRAAMPLEDSERTLLDRMAQGECTKDERREAVGLLVANREAMQFFAATLKGEDYEPAGRMD